MKDLKVNFTRTSSHDLPAPEYATSGAAAFDFRANLPDGSVTLAPGASFPVPTGFAFEIPEGYVGLVFARSGLAAKNSVNLTNGVGVIDSDYRGEIKVLLFNAGKTDFVINHGERIAQMVIMPFAFAALNEVSVLSNTERGAGGFGSTGRR